MCVFVNPHLNPPAVLDPLMVKPAILCHVLALLVVMTIITEYNYAEHTEDEQIKLTVERTVVRTTD